MGYIANQLKQQQQTEPQYSSNTFLRGLQKFGQHGQNIANSIADSITSPFVKVAGSGIRNIQSIPSLLQGNVAESQQIADTPIFGKKTLSGSTPLQNIGTAAQVGSFLVGGEAIGPAAQGFLRATVKTGTLVGALQGAGAYVEGAADPTLGEAAKNTAIGAGVGGLFGLVSGLIGKVGILPKNAVNDLETTYNEVFTGTKSAKKTLLSSQAKGKSPARFGAENGYIVDVAKDGKINSQPLIEKVKTDVQPYNDTYKSILRVMDNFLPEDQKVSIDTLGQLAKQEIRTAKARGSGNLPDAEKTIDKIINNLRQTYGDNLNLSQLDEIRSGQWAESSSFNPNRPNFEKDVNYALGKSSKNILALKTAKEPTAAKLLNNISDHYDFIENLRKIDGNVVRGGRLGKYMARIIGATVGASHGPLGSIAGAEAGDFVARIAQSNSIANPVKRQILESIPKDSSLYESAQQALRVIFAEGVDRQTTMKALPTPSQIQMGSRTYPETKMNISPAEPQLYRNKTGQINKGYKSVPQTSETKIGGKIPRDDLNVMSDFTDYVAGSYKPSKIEQQRLELDASRIAERYGLKKAKTLQGLANKFGYILEENGFKR